MVPTWVGPSVLWSENWTVSCKHCYNEGGGKTYPIRCTSHLTSAVVHSTSANLVRVFSGVSKKKSKIAHFPLRSSSRSFAGNHPLE